jgi:hypothetical protein
VTKRARATARKVAGNKEGEGGKAVWQWQQGWQASNANGEEEGNGDGDGNKGGG